ncbi:unnamed protein product [Linum trigynum]|uniref:Uncharacterized protein n=1 Tax=Linum trigynum TaxID=586398 RepID=A0AAV2DM54_9ROSI
MTDPQEHLNGFNSLTAAADVEKLARGHGGTAGSGGSGGIPDSNSGGGNVPAGGAVMPVIIAGAANNNHHQNNRRGASTCNISNINIYWRGLVTFVTTVTLACLRQQSMCS